MAKDTYLHGVAECIADRLLTQHYGSGNVIEMGTRLQIMQKQSDGTERNLGGRNRQCLVRDIHEQLELLGFIEPE